MKGGHLGKQKEVKSTTRLWTPCGYHLPIMSWSNPGISVSNNDQSMLDQSQATISKDRARARRRSKLGSWPRNTLHLLQTPWGTGWWFEPLWKILVSWDYYSQYIWKNKKCSKPPTSWGSNDILLRATHLLRATAKQKGYWPTIAGYHCWIFREPQRIPNMISNHPVWLCLDRSNGEQVIMIAI